jgi:hypothetical protein
MPRAGEQQIDPDRENAYRRGYGHGVGAVIGALQGHLTKTQIDQLELWLANQITPWQRDLGVFQPPAPPAL